MSADTPIRPSVPEPPPAPEGVEVTPRLVAWLQYRGFEFAARDVLARDAFGRAKYGQPLMTSDGRDGVEDARQEIADALQYVFKAMLTGGDVEPLRRLLTALVTLFDATDIPRVAP